MATTPARLDIAKESSQQNLIETQKMVPLGSNDDEDDKTGHEGMAKMSPRLQKAKLLLDQLTTEDDEEPSLNVGASQAITSADSKESDSKQSKDDNKI